MTTKVELEIIKSGLEEKIKVLEGQLEKQSQTAPDLAAAESEDESGGAKNTMEAFFRSMLQQQEASYQQLKEQQEASRRQLKKQQEASQATLEATLRASEDRFSDLLKNLWSELGQVDGGGSRTTSTFVNNRGSSTITKLHLKAPPVLEKGTDYRNFINWRKTFDMQRWSDWMVDHRRNR